MKRPHNYAEIEREILGAGWLLTTGKDVVFASRQQQRTPDRQTIEAVLEDCQRIGCHSIEGELGAHGDRGKQTLKTQYSCNSLMSKGPFAPACGADLDWYNDHLQVLVFDTAEGGDPAMHIRLNADGTIAEIVMRSRDMLKLCVFEGEARQVSEWEKARDGV